MKMTHAQEWEKLQHTKNYNHNIIMHDEFEGVTVWVLIQVHTTKNLLDMTMGITKIGGS